jgi:LacI family transcriptional regulator, galactose operon repressor
VKKKVTLRDIGDKLGLSAMTVSLALRDNARISPATKARVRDAMRRMNYKPNQLARALATGRSNLIGVIVPNNSDPYYAEVIRAIEDASRCSGYHVLLANGSYEMEQYVDRVKEMMSLHMGGIIAAPPFTIEKPRLGEFWQELRESTVEVVLINRQLNPPIFHQVAADYIDGVRKVVEALSARGHRRVAYISGRPAMLPIRQRLAAFRRFARKHGFEDDESLYETSALTFEGGYEAGARLWTRNQVRPTAIVAFSDVVGVGLLRFLDEAGVKVPDEASVVGFDGTAIGEYTQQSLSTVSTPMYEIGSEAFALLLGAMQGRVTEPRSVILPVELKLRESIGSVLHRPGVARLKPGA